MRFLVEDEFVREQRTTGTAGVSPASSKTDIVRAGDSETGPQR